jgi:CheY-like chemotaxis protein
MPPERPTRSALSRAVNDDLRRLSAAHDGARRIVCECSRRGCTELLETTLDDYDAVRDHPTRFLVAAGHELASVQRVLSESRGVAVIQERQESLRLQPPVANGRLEGNGRRPRVLIVGDDPTIRALSTSLRVGAVVVLEAPNGRRGLAQARAGRPDLVLTDVTMAALDGFQLAQALRDDLRTRGIPLIFHSARAGAADAARGYQLGALAYVPMPADTSAVALLVAGVLARFASETGRVRKPRHGLELVT